MKHAIYINDDLFAESANEEAIGKSYQTLLNDALSFADDGMKSVELRKIDDAGNYESVYMMRHNSKVVVNPEAAARETKPASVPETKPLDPSMMNRHSRRMIAKHTGVKVEGKFPSGKIPEGGIAQAIDLAMNADAEQNADLSGIEGPVRQLDAPDNASEK